MTEADQDLDILLDVLRRSLRFKNPPEKARFRVKHEARRRRIDALVDQGWLDGGDYYRVTLAGLRGLVRAGHDVAQDELKLVWEAAEVLQQRYRREPGSEIGVGDLAYEMGIDEADVRRAAFGLSQLHVFSSWTGDYDTFKTNERILDVAQHDVMQGTVERPEPSSVAWRITSVAIDGYRGLQDLHAPLTNPTVIIGANGTGKTSLVDALRLLQSATQGPLPPGIEAGGRTTFRVGGPERLVLEVMLAADERPDLRYRVELLGPSSAPRFASERLASVSSGPDEIVLLDFAGGQGSVSEPEGPRFQWKVPSAELALRRAIDPGLWTCQSVLSSIEGWAFYPGFDTDPNAEIRRPARVVPRPRLQSRGENLSAVLHWIKLHDADAFSEVETVLRAVIPDFRSLGLTTPEEGKVLAQWHEHGVARPLPIGDVSDGILRFLCLVVLCLSPTVPRLICIDEPETGLHPRALPVVADLLHRVAERSQVVALTHSPDLLSGFELSEIAVMRREDDAIEFVRPEDSVALRRHVEQVGPAAISRLHVSEELEILP